MSAQLTFFTIGHGTAELDVLFKVLAAQTVDILVDVRSSPYSRYVPQANREILSAAAQRHGVRYVFLGAELGGRPADQTMMLPNGKPDYTEMAATESYRRGIEALAGLADGHRVCLMCSEEDPANCHRTLLVSETLVGQGHNVLHIRHDGHVETHAQVVNRRSGGQLALF
ncbi:MAG TPA: DUF488 domain-containing protein [Phycisphaerae bacterium]|nr:DUF488 domain-containing protein [Phycisphaerae bacterium]